MRGWIAVLVACGCGRVGFGAGDAGPAIDSRPCFAGYLPASTGSCYRVVTGDSTIEVPWLEAEADCEADGAHLIVVDDLIEAELVIALVPVEVTNLWVGITELVTADVYRTVTDRPITFLPWEPGEPDAGDDCLALRDTMTIQDLDCAAEDDYVCEDDGFPAVPAAYTP